MRISAKKILIAVAVLILAIGSHSVFAGSDRPTVIFDAAANEFSFENAAVGEDGELHFFDLTGIMPGDSFTADVDYEIKNVGRSTVKLYFQPADPDDNYRSIFGTQNTEEVFLGAFDEDEKGTFTLPFNVPVTVGNEFQKAAASVKWTFYAEVIRNEGSVAPPSSAAPKIPEGCLPLAEIQNGGIDIDTVKVGDFIVTPERYVLNVTERRADGSLVLKLVIDESEPGSVLRLNITDHFKYVVGYPDGNVRPLDDISRAEVAEIFYRCLTDKCRTYYESVQNGFTDVASNSWYNTSVSTLANMGVLQGYPDGTFKPDKKVTREEFAAICAKFFQYIDAEAQPFDDVKGRWSEDAVACIYTLGYIQGYPDGTYKPAANITRAEAFTIMNNMLFRHSHTEGILESTKFWPDNADKSEWYYSQVQEASDSHDEELILTGSAELQEDWVEINEGDFLNDKAEWSLRNNTVPSN